MESDRQMVEYPEGEWVKWEDVEKETHEAYKAGYFTGQNSEILSQSLGIECNCVEMAHGIVSGKRVDHPWMCPAHGYKKR